MVVETNLAAATSTSEWTVILPIILPVILAMPGIIAFYWTWKDRKYKRAAADPYGVWEIDPKPDKNGWHTSRIDIKNQWNEPLYGTKVIVKGWSKAKIFHQGSNPINDLDAAESAKSIPVAWEFLSSSRTGQLISSGGTFLFVRFSEPSNSTSGTQEQQIQIPSSLLKLPQTQQGDLKPVLGSQIGKLRLEVSLHSASNRKARCIIHARWSRTALNENPAKQRSR